MRGEKSNSEYFALNTWENEKAQPIFDSLSQLSHPVIDMAELGELSPATLVSGKDGNSTWLTTPFYFNCFRC